MAMYTSGTCGVSLIRTISNDNRKSERYSALPLQTTKRAGLCLNVAVGMSIARHPRTDPCERYSRTRFLPWIFGVEAHSGIWVEDTNLRKQMA
jgi:hypothetical protein